MDNWKKQQQQQHYASQIQREVHLASYFLRLEFLIAISLSHLISLSSKARKTFKLGDWADVLRGIYDIWKSEDNDLTRESFYIQACNRKGFQCDWN